MLPQGTRVQAHDPAPSGCGAAVGGRARRTATRSGCWCSGTPRRRVSERRPSRRPCRDGWPTRCTPAPAAASGGGRSARTARRHAGSSSAIPRRRAGGSGRPAVPQRRGERRDDDAPARGVRCATSAASWTPSTPATRARSCSCRRCRCSAGSACCRSRCAPRSTGTRSRSRERRAPSSRARPRALMSNDPPPYAEDFWAPDLLPPERQRLPRLGGLGRRRGLGARAGGRRRLSRGCRAAPAASTMGR